jgi:methyl-accepting chemotaxis protein
MNDVAAEARSLERLPIRPLAVAVVILSVVGVAIALLMTQSLSRDVRSSISVTHSALDAIGQTIDAVDEVAVGTSASLDSTAMSVSSASATLEEAVSALEGVAEFLDQELPQTLESIQTSMPAAIQTANAVDGTLRALSLVGVDYDPEEPFGESLSRVNTALATLPSEVRAQSESLRVLIPSAEQLAADTDDLATSLEEVEDGLAGFTSLTQTYQTTVAEAETTIVATSESIDLSLWMIRALILAAGVLGVLVGLVLWSLAQRLETLTGTVDRLHHERREVVVTAPID